MDETELKAYLVKRLQFDFEIVPEVPGSFLVDGTRVVIDYLFHPRPHLVERGFEDGWFGVEVKSPQGGQAKGLRVAWQAITYSMSEFNGKRPPFIVLYPSLDAFFGSASDAYRIKTLLQKANVGYFVLEPQSRAWRIKFGAGLYFHSDTGLSKTPNIATKRNVGTW